MKYKTLFRLLLKAIGVWLFLNGCCEMLGRAIFVLFSSMNRARFVSLLDIGFITALMSQIAAGLYLFFGGQWIVNRAIPGNRPYCPECGYDLTGKTAEVCPECGTKTPS